MNGERVGLWFANRQGTPVLQYSDEWLRSARVRPLSLSLPILPGNEPHSGDRVALYSRDLNEVTEQFPEVAEAAAAHSDDVILDGEVLAFRDGRVLPFHDLQSRLGRRNPSAAVRAEVPVIYVAWDLLLHAGDQLLDTPLRDRRRRLEELSLGDGFALAHLEPAVGSAAV